jgi:hypothetical protein
VLLDDPGNPGEDGPAAGRRAQGEQRDGHGHDYGDNQQDCDAAPQTPSLARSAPLRGTRPRRPPSIHRDLRSPEYRIEQGPSSAQCVY